MRLPVTHQVSTKDGTSNKNARLTNCLKESKQSGDKAVIRPGLVLSDTYAGLGNGLIPFDGRLLVIFDDTVTDVEEDSFPWPLDSNPWGATVLYTYGDAVWYNGAMWFSTEDGNTGNTPGTGAEWARSYETPVYDAGTTYAIGDIVSYDGVTYFSYQAGNIGNTPSGSSVLWKTTPPGTERYYGFGGGYDAAPVDGTGPTCASKDAALAAWYAERTARSCATSSAATGWSWLALPYGAVGSPGIGGSTNVSFTAWVNGSPRNCTNQINAGLIPSCTLFRTA